MIKMRILLTLLSLVSIMGLQAQRRMSLQNDKLFIEWERGDSGYAIKAIKTINSGSIKKLASASGTYTFLYSKQKPDTASLINQLGVNVAAYPGSSYKYIINTWRQNLTPVPMNTAGEAINFLPATAVYNKKNSISFEAATSKAIIKSTWALDPVFTTDILVQISLEAKEDGYYSIASPALANITTQQLRWGIIPGVLQGASIEPDLVKSYAYGHGIPDKPVVVRERTTSTLSPMLTTKSGITIAAIPEPGLARDPWSGSFNTHGEWKVGFSLMNRQSVLSPTCYYPVLGEPGSFLHQGEKKVFSFRYSIQSGDWYQVFTHVVNNIYRFPDFLKLKNARQSLTSRILKMDSYLHSDKTSLWRVEDFNNNKIGAQAYLGGVVGSDKDAMKNSDYGAMWMLAHTMSDTILLKTRLPFARNFKLAQQQVTDGFFKGAAIGQYYLSKSKRFTEEWGNYVEPIALTYYIMIDIGNMLLFDSTDTVLKERLRLGAEKLLQWQHTDGHWEVAYDRATSERAFTDLTDYRPTFYGLMVAYKILGDKKYLKAAVKGANWFIKEAVNKRRFLGVCGDLRFAPDFATIQSAEALLELYSFTKDQKYLAAAIEAAKFYTTSIYTHPIPDRQQKKVNGQFREDWEIAQAGLSFEHGGTVGSATKQGPILLASHAGHFVRMFNLTKDSMFINMARAAALGRDAFVNPETSVASYYWNAMNAGAGPYPNHAWWQVGWLTDYLLSEIELRSSGKIYFPSGFITPKVGAHKSYGFAPGYVFGEKAHLVLPRNILHIEDATIDYFCARSVEDKALYFFILNNSVKAAKLQFNIDVAEIEKYTGRSFSGMAVLDEKGKDIGFNSMGKKNAADFQGYGLRVIKVELSDK